MTKVLAALNSFILTILLFFSSIVVPVKVVVDPSKTAQTVTGFGSSACWWAQQVSAPETAQALVDKLYTTDGLGLSIYRYNVGAGSADQPDHKISSWRATESFYYYNTTDGKYEYDWSRDANAQNMLRFALKGTAKTVVLFANSPHYSMTISGTAAGNPTANETNLAADNYGAYADYFLTITQHFLDEGIPVKYISPINEPQWSWGTSQDQEGCYYTADQATALLTVFAQKMQERGMTGVKLCAPESGQISAGTEDYFTRMTTTPVLKDMVGSLAYHSYWEDGCEMTKKSFGSWLKSNVSSDYTVDMTEYCELPCKHSTDDIEGALLTARTIAEDFSLVGVNSWSEWVAVNAESVSTDGKDYCDGLISAKTDFSSFGLSMKYFALAQFSEFIPAGSKMISCNMSVFGKKVEAYADEQKQPVQLTAASFLTPDGSVVTVIVNEGNAKNISLSGVSGSAMKVVATTASARLNQTYSGAVKTSLLLQQNSITTIVVSK